jgi:3-hydroxyisobutyrate dehydrogenase-like beta-hydroxyacid dehydrogenase
MTENSSIGFIGLGMLGKPMAENLLSAGYRLRVFNRSSEKAASLAQSGATVVSDPLETAEPGGIVLSCVTDDAALREVAGSGSTLAGRLGQDGVHVSMSTILPETAEELSRQHAACGCHYIAAPVMGRPDVVKAQKQSYFAAGNLRAMARIRPVLESISMRVFDFGEIPADAHTAKLAANFLIAASIEAMSEAFTFVEKNGADPAMLQDALGSTLFACPIYQNYGRQILEASYQTPLFKLSLGLKDLRLITQTADNSGTPMRLASALKDRFLAAAAHGRSNCDWTGIAAEVREEAGL